MAARQNGIESINLCGSRIKSADLKTTFAMTAAVTTIDLIDSIPHTSSWSRIKIVIFHFVISDEKDRSETEEEYHSIDVAGRSAVMA